MQTNEDVSQTIDAKGEVCPIPLAKAKGAVDALAAGDVLEVLATERNSLPDFERWATMTDGIELVEQRDDEEDGETVFKHYIRKTG